MRTTTITLYDQEDVSKYYNDLLDNPSKIINELDRLERVYINKPCQDEEFNEYEYWQWKNASVLRAAIVIIEGCLEDER